MLRSFQYSVDGKFEQQTFPKASNGTGLIENLSKHLSNCLAVHHWSFREGEISIY
jgi:hypothetical protein